MIFVSGFERGLRLVIWLPHYRGICVFLKASATFTSQWNCSYKIYWQNILYLLHIDFRGQFKTKLFNTLNISHVGSPADSIKSKNLFYCRGILH